jgi:hypothetical protein
MATATIAIPEELVREVEDALPRAVRGDTAAARRYARAWSGLVRALLADHGGDAAAARVLDLVALTAPFHPQGPLQALMSAAAGIMPDMRAPSLDSPAARLPDPLTYERFASIVLEELSGAGTGLEHLMASWRLSVADVARLFDVSRQAVQQWLVEGVPPARQPKLLQLQRIAELLERNLRPERIPAVVRSDAEAYAGRTMLASIADDRQDELLASVERSFDWAATA